MEGIEVALPEMLDARERRVWCQQELLKRYEKPLICFSMNIAGPIKNNRLIRRGFEHGVEQLKNQLKTAQIPCLFSAEINENTGNELYFVADAQPLAVKALTAELEDASPVGRLFDMDVLDTNGKKLDRSQVGLPPRRCLICGKEGSFCARSRSHTVVELQDKTEQILRETVQKLDSRRIAQLAVQSLLFEVATTPKAGLVDRADSGSHQDMDIFTFLASSTALHPYFEDCAVIGMQTASEAPERTFARIRAIGKQAEWAMYSATNGVNTHKGAVFSVGILCAALGRIERNQWSDVEAVLAECGRMTTGIVERDFAHITAQNARTVGQRLYAEYGITGVRGQAEAGFPAVLNVGLPTLERGVAEGYSLNDAGCGALLALMCQTVDTNLIARSNVETQRQVVEQVSAIIKKTPFPAWETLAELNRQFVAKNLSAGGSADLLAMSYFVYFLKQRGENKNV